MESESNSNDQIGAIANPVSNEFALSESLVPVRDLKPAATRAVPLDGLLNPPLQLKEDLKDGCGGQIWPAGVILSKYMIENHASDLGGKTIIELGGGSGLVGLAVARGCAIDSPIYITDQTAMISLIRQNIELNGLSGSVKEALLDWGDPEAVQALPRASVILAADCVYYEPAFPLLLSTLQTLLEDKDAVCYFCFKKRRKADMRFIRQVRKKFDVKDVTGIIDREYCARQKIFLYTITKRREKELKL